MRYIPDLTILLIIYIFLLRRWKAGWYLFVNTMLYIYLSAVLLLTLSPVITALPFITNHPYEPMHLVPFNDLVQHYGDAERQIILNVLLFIPMGVLLPAVKKQGFFSTVIKVFCVSLFIELLQPLLNASRSSDITDVITNTTGGSLGFLLYLPFRHFIENMREKKK